MFTKQNNEIKCFAFVLIFFFRVIIFGVGIFIGTNKLLTKPNTNFFCLKHYSNLTIVSN